MRRIRSLRDLREAKLELADKREITKKEFAKHLGTLRQDTTAYVLKKVVLPLGVGALGAFVIKYFFFDKEKPADANEKQEHTSGFAERSGRNDDGKKSWLDYFNVLLSVIRIYQSALKNQQHSAEEMGTDPTDKEAEASTADQDEDSPFSPRSFVQQYQDRKAKE